MVHPVVVHVAVVLALLIAGRVGRLRAITAIVSLPPGIEQLRGCAIQHRIDRLLISNIDACPGAGQLVPDPIDDFGQLGSGKTAHR
ncbi:hypothetical protein AN933_25875 [Mycobacterium intracellulare subsp. chimaera]|nr:hypothetical protein AN933_25875 [Mycobacterium intracellulare subsp. chimaera]